MSEIERRGKLNGRETRETFARAVAGGRRALARHKSETLGACLLVLMAANLLSVISRKTITNDEVVHIPAGYYHLVAGDFHFNNEHPPLIKMWAALPLLFIQPEEPPAPADAPDNNIARTWDFHARFWPANRAHYETITFWTRVMMLALALALGVLIFVFTRKLFDARAALFALALYTLEPTVLAHGRIVHTDAPAALAYLLFFYTLYRYRHEPTWRRALVVGAACGAALITKFSMIVLAPLLLAVALAGVVWLAPRGALSRARVGVHACTALGVVLLIVNAAYYFQSPPLAASEIETVRLKSAPVFEELMTGFGVFSKLVPTYFLYGLYNVVIHNHYGHAASLLGMYRDDGWWYYFPVAFALKTSIPFLLVSLAALGWSVWRLLMKRDGRFLFLVVPLGIYTAISFASHINIGIRHFLPVFPFLFIMSGALLDRLLRRQRMRRAALAIVVVVVGWAGVEAARGYPDYVPYMNQFASARPHWYYLSDSNVEWGDDVPALAAYLHARGETSVRAALAGGWATLRFYDIEYLDLFATAPEQLPAPRYVAIGASFLNGSTVPGEENQPGRTFKERTNFFARYRERTPEAIFGKSIYLFREDAGE